MRTTSRQCARAGAKATSATRVPAVLGVPRNDPSGKTSMSEESGAAGKLLFLVTEDWYFCSHRMELARRAAENGFEVSVATRVQAHGADIERAGLGLLPLPWRRS